MSRLQETDLYPPVKAFLEGQGYAVKSEISNCDVVAVRGEEDPVIVELKTAFTLPLVLQGIRRQTVTDHVYLAFAIQTGRPAATVWRRHARDVLKLCRMLGLGLMTVRMAAEGPSSIEIHLDPAPYQPRKNKRRRGMLLQEFHRRVGDPNQGGATKQPVMTAYRQDALRCAAFLQRGGASRAVVVKTQTGVIRAPQILQKDHYGWFQRVARGTYALTPNGERALDTYADVVAMLE
ncbi:MAG: hypothetical protein GKS00_16760 [Alphaproteobacteria bacterium]|nr:hypothetical protein [Alphaproteobacteria bacterium]